MYDGVITIVIYVFRDAFLCERSFRDIAKGIKD
jgi:hypothetical protein